MKETIRAEIESHIKIAQEFMQSQTETIEKIAQVMIEALRGGGKILLCGNGGSAADSQHFAAEMVGRFKINRPAIPAVALSTDTSVLTCVANDFSFEEIFSRQVEALAAPGDVCVGISTSGSSPNVLAAIKVAKEKGLKTVGFTKTGGEKLMEMCDVTLLVPADTTDRIQEYHELAIHIICGLIEQSLYGD